jgi:hypothetical protein
MLLLHDTVMPPSVGTTEAIAKFEWIVILQPWFRRDLIPSDYHPFSPLKWDCEDIISKKVYNITYRTSTQSLIQPWKKTVKTGTTLFSAIL